MSEESTISPKDEIKTICQGCKVDFSKKPHKEDCPVISEKIAEEKAREAEQEKILAEEIAREATEKARQELAENNAKEIEKIKLQIEEAKSKESQDRLKKTIISRIKQIAPDEDIDSMKLETCTIDQLSKIYQEILKITKEEKKAKPKYKVSCPSCGEFLGKSDTMEDAQEMQKFHKKEKHHSVAGWVITAVIFGLLTAGAVGAYRLYKKSKSKDEQK